LDKIPPLLRQNKIAKYVTGDILDPKCLADLISEVDLIIHLASLIGILRAIKLPLDTLQTNILGTYGVLQAATQAGRKRVLLCSSSIVYGKTPHIPIAEEDDLLFGNLHIPSWTYGISKLSQEAFALSFHRQCGTPVQICRLFNCIGPGQSGALGNVLPRFATAAIANEPLVIHGDGNQTRAFIDVRDTVTAIFRIIQKGAVGNIYNIGGTDEISMNSLAALVIEEAQSSSRTTHVENSTVFGHGFEEPRRRVPNVQKLQALGFNRQYSLESTIRDVIRHERALK